MSNGIGKNPLNDISKVYVQQVVEKKKDDTYLGRCRRRRKPDDRYQEEALQPRQWRS